MFYYLLYNSSFSFIENNRLFSAILYGSILYIITHAIINYCGIELLTIIANYFWFIFILDIITFGWSLYQLIMLTETNASIPNDLQVSFNLLNNKINTFLDRKNNLTITQNTSAIQSSNQQHQYNPNPRQQNNLRSSNKFSTPISEIQKKQQHQIPQNNANQQSTPINLIRGNVNITEPIIMDMNTDISNESGNDLMDDTNGSVAGSDVGSILDLDDFEKTI